MSPGGRNKKDVLLHLLIVKCQHVSVNHMQMNHAPSPFQQPVLWESWGGASSGPNLPPTRSFLVARPLPGLPALQSCSVQFSLPCRPWSADAKVCPDPQYNQAKVQFLSLALPLSPTDGTPAWVLSSSYHLLPSTVRTASCLQHPFRSSACLPILQ